jgi:hypothetical protein
MMHGHEKSDLVIVAVHRQSKESFFATGISTGLAPEPTKPEKHRRCMSMRRPRPPCSQLRRHITASTTSPNRTDISLQRRRGACSASTRTFG